ncbi:MAG: hypothetical protein ACI364_06285 [Coriobacteriales bacterium]
MSKTHDHIVQAFLSALDERPIDKIRVTDVTSACSVCRNTFYYHFADMFCVFDAVIANARRYVEKAVQTNGRDWHAGLAQVFAWLEGQRGRMLHVYDTSYRARLVRAVSDVSLAFVRAQARELGVGMNTSLVEMCAAALLGAVLRWLDDQDGAAVWRVAEEALALLEASGARQEAGPPAMPMGWRDGRRSLSVAGRFVRGSARRPIS